MKKEEMQRRVREIVREAFALDGDKLISKLHYRIVRHDYDSDTGHKVEIALSNWDFVTITGEKVREILREIDEEDEENE